MCMAAGEAAASRSLLQRTAELRAQRDNSGGGDGEDGEEGGNRRCVAFPSVTGESD